MANKNEDKAKLAYQKDSKITILEKDYKLKDNLKPGYYKIHLEQMGFFYSRAMIQDESLVLPNSAMNVAKEYIDFDFIDQYFSDESKDLHFDLGLKNKLGILLHGSQGTGKSTVGHCVCKYMVEEHGAAAFMLNSPDYTDITFVMEFITQVRAKVGHFTSVIFVDESEELLKGYEGEMKSILDSNESISDNFFIFTTNYPDDIPGTIIRRPSRIKFDISIEGIYEEATIWEIVKSMNNSINKNKQLDDDMIRDLIPDLKGYKVDQIKNRYLDLVFEHHISKTDLNKITGKNTMPA